MKTGERWSSWKAVLIWPLFALPQLAYAPGCAKDRAAVERNLMARQPDYEGVAQCYRVACPDVVALDIAGRPEFAGKYEIAADGRINLGDYGKPRIEGCTLPEAAKLLAEETGASPASVQIKVAEFRSQHVLLYGEVIGGQRSVPYRGPETVLDLLQRVGGITPDGAPSDVYVVRPHIGANHRPEVFHVDLDAIVMKQDHKTNLRLLAFDQVYVGATRQAKIEAALPPWLRWIVQPWDTHSNPK
jgi:protein involved in polysaccharide export with SLBB domain